jgi:Mg2+-importing ATPase
MNPEKLSGFWSAPLEDLFKELETSSITSLIFPTLIVLVVRTRKPFYKSRPGKYLLIATLAIIIFTLFIPVLPLLNIFEFVSLSPIILISIGIIIALYILSAEIAKRIFYKYSSN